ncbi:hypothetical protein ABMY35_03095 [Pseudoalteromonas sp. BZB3]|uniref:Uncharacterized protein n=1 Tax=Pseudoalteromonas phenolica TaxID=161398 RepID=A0A5R9Q061_9GAMM|nr:hypothetical protein [Pseudoalteromonas phenolica]TLX46012.1 hypothetical protein C1E24_15965 [Pseudoalteromonas phenolica]|tara:strand:+ start:8116 stop:8334 length:219 start_codon:yes stop_codon:yes gene_type:complete
MKLKLNKKKMKTLSADSSNIPAEMTPQVAGGTQINSSYVTYRCPPIDGPSADGMTHCVANTCGRGHTCGEIY